MFLNAGSGICKGSNNAPLPIISIVTCRRGEYNRVTGFLLQIEDGAMHFFPVWYFQCKLGEKGITLLALDARNGAVIYMG